MSRPAARRTPRTAVIIANGRLASTRGLRARLRRADLVICADGGVRVAHRVGVAPQIIIGDFDSAAPALLQWAAKRRARLVRHPSDKDKTDTELALEAAIERGATEVQLLGVLGRRVDHTLANVALLTKAASSGIRAMIIDGPHEIFLADAVTRVTGRKGDLVSLVPLTSTVGGVTLKGFRFPLTHATVKQGSTLTISNILEVSPALVRVSRGQLLVVVTHR